MLILLLPVAICGTASIRIVTSFVWLFSLMLGDLDFFGIHDGCAMNCVFYFPSLVMVLFTTLLNLAIWINFVISACFIRSRRAHLLWPL